jgi:hypothetical protein
VSEPINLDALRAQAESIHGDRIAVLELGGRVWCVAVPRSGFRGLWQRFKTQQNSPDPTTKADAAVQLARAMLVPVAAPSTDDARKALRADFDAMGEEFPALLDVLGETAEALALGPLPIRAASPPSSSSADGATPTSPPTA